MRRLISLAILSGMIFLSCWSSLGYTAEDEKVSKMLEEAKRAWTNKDIKVAQAIFEKVLEEDSENAEGLFYLARINLGKNHFKKGVDLFRKAIEVAPENAVLHLNLARVYEESRYYFLAENEYEKVLSLITDPNDPVYKEAKQRYQFSKTKHEELLAEIKEPLEKGRKLYADKKMDAARREFSSAVTIYPTYAEPYFFLGNILLKQGDFGAGLKLMETSRWNAPSNVRVQLTLARVYEEGRQLDDAEKEYQHVLKRMGKESLEGKEAIKRLAVIAALRADIKSKEAEIKKLLEEGKAFFTANEPIKAELKFQKVIELDVGRAEAYYYLGRIYLGREEYRKGGEYTEKAVQYSPRNVGLILTLARIYEQGGLTENATKYYNRALFYADPESEQAAEATDRLNQMGEGEMPNLLAAINANSDDIRSRVRLAQIYLQQSQVNEAIGQLEAIVRIEGDEEIVKAAHQNLAAVYLTYGKRFIARKKLSEALGLFEQAKEHDPENAEVYYMLGVGYARNKELDKAIEFLLQAVKLKADYFEAYENLALAYRVQKKYDKAIEAYSQAAAYDDDPKTAKATALQVPAILVEKYREKKEWDKAIQLLKEIIALQPNDPSNYFTLMQVYADKSDPLGVVEYGEEFLKLQPNAHRIRMWVAQTYNQIRKSEKAVRHFKLVARGADDEEVKTQAENMLAQIERAKKLRFNYNLRYNFSTSGVLDDVTADLPSSSNLSFSMTSSFRIKDASFNITLAPRYSVNHRSQTDSFNVGFTATSNFSPYYKFPLTVGYSYTENSNLLTEVKNSFGQNVFIAPRAYPIKVPKKFWFLNDGILDRDKENITFTLRTQVSYRDQSLFSGRSIFLLRVLAVNTTLQQSYTYRSVISRLVDKFSFLDGFFNKDRNKNTIGSFNITYLYSENRNKDVFGRDLALKKNQLQLAINQRLLFGVSTGLSYRIAFDNYTNRDSDFGVHRRVLTQAASASLSRSLIKELSVSVAYSWTNRSSNLERGVIRANNRQPIALQPADFGSRVTYGGSWSSALNFNFRF